VSTKLEYPQNNVEYSIVGSCNGILCVAHQYTSFIQLWNPSIRKVKELPPFEEPPYPSYRHTYGFGYDFVTDSYKVVVISFYHLPNDRVNDKTEVKVNTLGTNFWKNMQEFPFGMPDCIASGKFVGGTINWLASEHWHQSPCFIVSLDLGKESFRKVSLPDYYGEIDESLLFLSVLRDSLCLMYGHEVWIMKEYGNEDSWTKLFTVSYMRDPSKSYYLTKAVYMFEDGQVLFEFSKDGLLNMIVHDPRIGTIKNIKFQDKSVYNSPFDSYPVVCIESLISPCF
jgi:F-box interacting protein